MSNIFVDTAHLLYYTVYVKKVLTLCLFAFLICIYQCQYGKLVRLERKINLPYKYYRGAKGFTIAKPGFWSSTKNKKNLEVSEYYLFTDSAILQKTTQQINNGQVKEVRLQLNKYFSEEKYNSDNLLIGKIHNSIAFSYLIEGNLEKAKKHINQAGLMSQGNLHIIKNNRIISTFFQKFKPIK